MEGLKFWDFMRFQGYLGSSGSLLDRIEIIILTIIITINTIQHNYDNHYDESFELRAGSH